MTLPKQKRRKPFRFLIAIALVVLVGFLFMRKDPQPAQVAHATPAPQPSYSLVPNWPTDVAAAAIGVKGHGVLASKNDTKKRPIASIAKVITALAILERKPLKDDQSGPSIPITDADERLYRDYVAKNGTVVLVKSGVPLSERDAIEAMLLPSANNIADTAAIWAFGSLKAYSKYANAMLARHGIHDTIIGVDASGLDPSTQSTASDLVRIGELALNNSTVASIVALPSAQIPYAGGIPNYNAMVTRHGYTGIKPGESIQAGNTLLFSTNELINGEKLTLIGAVLNSPGYRESNAAALQIVDSVKATLKPVRQ